MHAFISNFVHWQTKCLSGNELRHWQTKCLSGNEFRSLTDKKSVSELKFIDWQMKCLSVHAKSSRRSSHWQNGVCQSMNLVIFSQIFWFFGITDRRNVCQQHTHSIRHFGSWQTFRLSVNEFKIRDRHFVCQWTKFIAWQTFCLSVNEIHCLTDILSIVYSIKYIAYNI